MLFVCCNYLVASRSSGETNANGKQQTVIGLPFEGNQEAEIKNQYPGRCSLKCFKGLFLLVIKLNIEVII
jgi:hypothetical protein